MKKIDKEISLAKSPQVIWSVLSDFGALAHWVPSIDHSERTTTQASGVGTTRRVQTGSIVLLEQVTVWQEDVELAYDIIGLPTRVGKVENRWKLLPGNSTSVTNVRLTSTVRGGSRPPEKALATVILSVLGRTSDALLNGLRVRVEGERT